MCSTPTITSERLATPLKRHQPPAARLCADAAHMYHHHKSSLSLSLGPLSSFIIRDIFSDTSTMVINWTRGRGRGAKTKRIPFLALFCWDVCVSYVKEVSYRKIVLKKWIPLDMLTGLDLGSLLTPRWRYRISVAYSQQIISKPMVDNWWAPNLFYVWWIFQERNLMINVVSIAM